MTGEIVIALFGALLTIITGLMAWQAMAIIKASNSIAVLGNSITTLEGLLENVLDDLKAIAKHDSLIAVLNSQVANLKADTSLIFEKVREMEHARVVHRR